MKINKTRLSIAPPAPFDFERTAYSHGWVVLAPNGWDSERKALRRVERLGSGKVVALDIRGTGPVGKRQIAVDVHHSGDLSQRERKEIESAVGRMFRVDEDLSAFYALCEKRGGRWKKWTEGLGKLLRSPTMFEDVVKVICTTNIQWSGTKRMVEGLVEAYGEPFGGDGVTGIVKNGGRGDSRDKKTNKNLVEASVAKAFPTPEAIAAENPDVFAESVRLGYRAPFVHELAVGVASGELDLEAFMDSDLPTPELKKELLTVKGVGAYAAASLLMILGRYDELAVDTVFRQFVREKYFDGNRPTDAEARAIYKDWGQWKYLAYWFDLWTGFDGEL